MEGEEKLKLLKKEFKLKNKKIINIVVLVIIKLTFNKLERNKKMSLQFVESENNEFIEDLEIKGKYCKEKLNKIIENEKKITLKKNLNQVVVIIVQILILMVIIILIFLLF